jgi:hypothetical protein
MLSSLISATAKMATSHLAFSISRRKELPKTHNHSYHKTHNSLVPYPTYENASLVRPVTLYPLMHLDHNSYITTHLEPFFFFLCVFGVGAGPVPVSCQYFRRSSFSHSFMSRPLLKRLRSALFWSWSDIFYLLCRLCGCIELQSLGVGVR